MPTLMIPLLKQMLLFQELLLRVLLVILQAERMLHLLPLMWMFLPSLQEIQMVKRSLLLSHQQLQMLLSILQKLLIVVVKPKQMQIMPLYKQLLARLTDRLPLHLIQVLAVLPVQGLTIYGSKQMIRMHLRHHQKREVLTLSH